MPDNTTTIHFGHHNVAINDADYFNAQEIQRNPQEAYNRAQHTLFVGYNFTVTPILYGILNSLCPSFGEARSAQFLVGVVDILCNCQCQLKVYQ